MSASNLKAGRLALAVSDGVPLFLLKSLLLDEATPLTHAFHPSQTDGATSFQHRKVRRIAMLSGLHPHLVCDPVKCTLPEVLSFQCCLRAYCYVRSDWIAEMETVSSAAVPDGDVTAVAEWVADVLRDRIIKGVLPAGERLVERKLSAELNVSRTPIREALKLLQADSLIDISRHKGAQVKDFSAQQALELFDVIASLESLAAERLAEKITRDQLEILEQLHARMLTQYHAGDADEYFSLNTEIHDTILGSCGNPILEQMHTKMMARARRGRFMAIMNPDRLKTAVEEHEQLMTAFRARNAEAARQIWRKHLLSTGQSVTEVLRNHGLG